MIIPTTIAIATKLPKLNSYNLLQLKTICNAVFVELREVAASKEQILINMMDFNMDTIHYISITAILLFLYGQYKYMEGHDSVGKKIRNIKRFETIKKITSEFLFIIIIVFIKNVESVY
jgi:Na+/alanine symporter